ncbi:hypothetical protein Tco_0358144, partial [Tanacetum coccineum]
MDAELSLSKVSEPLSNFQDESDLESMPEDEIGDADNLIKELADMNASVDKSSLSDPLGHLCNEVSNLTTK